MSLRRRHRKSRKGCIQCKSKHIKVSYCRKDAFKILLIMLKCDESAVVCGNCQRLGIQCVYASPKPRKRAVPTYDDPLKNLEKIPVRSGNRLLYSILLSVLTQNRVS